ncbi:MAG: CHAT domain-containing protein [Alkalinema sp. RU_4_3]|nr:CHAT domain-containing protein [Alkalinema sp. RU_4_3]
MNNLANAYFERIQGDRAENIEQAIACHGQALTVRIQDAMPVEWATTMMNLANAYYARIRGSRAENIEQAIARYGQALTVMTRDAMPIEWATTMNNLAAAYNNRIRGGRAENIEQAIECYKDCMTIFTPELLPDDCRRTARSLGNLYMEQQRWTEAETSYRQALKAAEILYQNANLLDSKAAELAATADLPRRAAYAMARTGNFQAAVETLEQGRARGLSESLDRDRTDLDQLQQLNPDLYKQYKEITQQLRNLESQQRDRSTSNDRHNLTPESLRESAIALRQQLNKLIENIRQVPDYEQFLALPTFEDVRRSAKPEKPLVYLAPTPAGSLALIVTPENIQAIWLDTLTETNVSDLLNNTWFAAYKQSQKDHQSWLSAIDSVTRQLWEPLMQPLIHHLKTHNLHQAILIPTGLLSFLPIHAAWTEAPDRPTGRHYALDDIHFTYAPNAKSLTAAQAIAQRVQPDSILAIDNPRNDLPNSEREVNAAIATFPQSTVLRHGEATMERVRLKLPGAAIVHFSCHGKAHTTETKIIDPETKEVLQILTPLDSCLQMSDGNLTLKDIFALNLAERSGIRLAILSACETSLSGIKNADEAISLPTGLLQAGVAGAIASLWSVSDLSTMFLLTKFYDLWRTQHLPPDQALRQAQLWMSRTTDGEKADYGKLTLPTALRDRYTYAHPFHWAAFSYLGV